MSPKAISSNATYRGRAAAQRQRGQIQSILMIAAGILIVIFVIFSLISKSPAQNVVPARMGAALGDFKLTDLNGKTVRLSDYKGRPVLINAWATWCPPCKAEMPLLNQYFQAHARDGFMLLAVNAGDTQSVAATFADQNGLAFPVLLDTDTQLLDQLGVQSFPTSILVGKDGKVKTIHIGMFTPDTIEAELTPLLEQ